MREIRYVILISEYMPNETHLRQNKAQERLAHVVKIVHRLFASQGYEKVGIREIAKEAGISPMQVYRLGVDKHDLLAEVI